MIESDFKNYIQTIEGDLPSNVNCFWSFASIKKQCVSSIPNKIFWKNETANTGKDVTNLFKSYFASVFELEGHHFDFKKVAWSNNNIDLNV